MTTHHRKGSLFSQKIDRVAVISYFLGAVVPLIALGFICERYVLPAMQDQRAAFGLMGVVGSIAVLSFSAFLVLRRTTRDTIEKIDQDNKRLAALLAASSKLADAQHITDATSAAARGATQLAGAPAAYIFLRGEGENERNLADSGGKNATKLYEKIHASLQELVEIVIEQGRPVLRGGPDDPTKNTDNYSAAVVPIPGEKIPMGAVAVVRPSGIPFQSVEVDALAMLASLSSVSLSNADLRDCQRNFFSHVTEIIVHALDSHLGYLMGHGERVAQISNRIGRVMNLDETRMEKLHFAALMHDIGMLKIDRKQQMNRQVCEKHPLLGHRMLMRIRLWKDLGPLVLHHHEWFDGSGYPEGISGEDIPLESRIIGLAEAFDTMTNESSYKTPMPLVEALREIDEGSGTQFDPKVVEAFRQLVEDGVIEV